LVRESSFDPLRTLPQWSRLLGMTMGATPPSTHEQVIEQRLAECGLSRGGFTVKYENYLQSIEIVITPTAGARQEHFPCIRQAAQHEIVSFADSSMQKAYSDYQAEILRPQMLENATAEVEKRGLLKNFPDRNSFASLELYAQALERHSGLAPGSVLRVSGQTIVFDPPRGQTTFRDFDKRYSSLLAVIMFATARGDFKSFGFIGNKAVAEPPTQ
jgi:hypothetical protein